MRSDAERNGIFLQETSVKSFITKANLLNLHVMKKLFLSILTAGLLAAGCASGDRTLHIVTTGDVHGNWFDEPYVEGQSTKTSLMSVHAWVDSLRRAVGEKNVLLLDAGDCLQGDNAPYYFNYVNTEGEHPFVSLLAYMKYDAVAVGNHDIETGHAVYDKIAAQLAAHGIPPCRVHRYGNAPPDRGPPSRRCRPRCRQSARTHRSQA